MYLKLFLLNILVLKVFALNGEHKKIHDDNKNKIEKNNSNIKKSKDQLNKQKNDLNNKFSKLEKVHNNIKTNGSNLKYSEYNKLVAEYGKLAKSYNDSRKGYCAELPPLWALRDRPKELTEMEKKCDKWYFDGKEFGLRIGKAIHFLGRRNGGAYNYHKWIKKETSCYASALRATGNRVKNASHFRECFIKGFEKQLLHTVTSLERGKNNEIYFHNPYKSLDQKENAIKQAMNSIKQTK